MFSDLFGGKISGTLQSLFCRPYWPLSSCLSGSVCAGLMHLSEEARKSSVMVANVLRGTAERHTFEDVRGIILALQELYGHFDLGLTRYLQACFSVARRCENEQLLGRSEEEESVNSNNQLFILDKTYKVCIALQHEFVKAADIKSLLEFQVEMRLSSRPKVACCAEPFLRKTTEFSMKKRHEESEETMLPCKELGQFFRELLQRIKETDPEEEKEALSAAAKAVAYGIIGVRGPLAIAAAALDGSLTI